MVSMQARLEVIARKAEVVAASIGGDVTCPSLEQCETLRIICLKLQATDTKITEWVEYQDAKRTGRVHEDVNKLTSVIGEARDQILAKNRVKNVQMFRKTMTLIFTGPTDSKVDSKWTLSRNKQTRKRCESIRELNPDGVISWAAALSPSSWMAGCLPTYTFESLLESIEPSEAQAWPSRLLDVVNAFGQEGVLAHSEAYQKFLRGKSQILFGPKANHPSDLNVQSASDSVAVFPRKRRSITNAVSGASISCTDVGLSGDVYELRHGDAPTVTRHIRGRISLTDPYDEQTQPFVTIPISWELRDRFIFQRM
jgi:hypothetical protein